MVFFKFKSSKKPSKQNTLGSSPTLRRTKPNDPLIQIENIQIRENTSYLQIDQAIKNSLKLKKSITNQHIIEVNHMINFINDKINAYNQIFIPYFEITEDEKNRLDRYSYFCENFQVKVEDFIDLGIESEGLDSDLTRLNEELKKVIELHNNFKNGIDADQKSHQEHQKIIFIEPEKISEIESSEEEEENQINESSSIYPLNSITSYSMTSGYLTPQTRNSSSNLAISSSKSSSSKSLKSIKSKTRRKEIETIRTSQDQNSSSIITTQIYGNDLGSRPITKVTVLGEEAYYEILNMNQNSANSNNPHNQQQNNNNNSSDDSQNTVVQNNICKICLENQLNCVLLNCGHICVCLDCASSLISCPICRSEIDRVIQTFHC